VKRLSTATTATAAIAVAAATTTKTKTTAAVAVVAVDNLFTSLQVLPYNPASSKKILFQVCFGLSLLLTPCGFQPNWT